MERFIAILWVFLSVASIAAGERRDFEKQNGGRLSFFALGDAGGYAYYPYFTKTLENVARQMGKVNIF